MTRFDYRDPEVCSLAFSYVLENEKCPECLMPGVFDGKCSAEFVEISWKCSACGLELAWGTSDPEAIKNYPGVR